jgi:hypothetical protein
MVKIILETHMMHINWCHATQRDASTEQDSIAFKAEVLIVEQELLTITECFSSENGGKQKSYQI